MVCNAWRPLDCMLMVGLSHSVLLIGKSGLILINVAFPFGAFFTIPGEIRNKNG